MLNSDWGVVIQDGKKRRGISLAMYPIQFLGMLLILSGLVPVLICHLWTFLFESVYFRVHRIPRTRLRDYLIIDRGLLKKLSLSRKISCIYCGYVNGCTAWFKAVSNMTEMYSCAIKHGTKKVGQEYQKDFYPLAKFL